MNDEKLPRDDVVKLCTRLGAPTDQARTMADQLVKRAAQMSRERKCTPHEALAYLLQVMIAGREGVAFTDKPPGEDPNTSPEP